jgi:hypothetical protein
MQERGRGCACYAAGIPSLTGADGRCRKLERLTCIYCRETWDAATEPILELAIKYYYAGLTQITDRSLEILGA